MDLKELAAYLRACGVGLPSGLDDVFPSVEREIEARVVSRMLGALEELCLGQGIEESVPKVFACYDPINFSMGMRDAGTAEVRTYACPPDFVEGFFRAVKAKFESLHDWSLLDQARKDRADAERREGVMRKVLALAVRWVPPCGHCYVLRSGEIDPQLGYFAEAGLCARCDAMRALDPPRRREK